MVVSKLYLSIAKTLWAHGNQLLSVKVSRGAVGTVTITSEACKPMPTAAGSFAPPRSICHVALGNLDEAYVGRGHRAGDRQKYR